MTKIVKTSNKELKKLATKAVIRYNGSSPAAFERGFEKGFRTKEKLLDKEGCCESCRCLEEARARIRTEPTHTVCNDCGSSYGGNCCLCAGQ